MAERIKRKTKVLMAEFPEGTVIFDLKTRRPHILSPLGSEIWRWLSRPKKKQEIVNLILKKYAVEKKQAARDLSLLLERLEKKDLIYFIRSTK